MFLKKKKKNKIKEKKGKEKEDKIALLNKKLLKRIRLIQEQIFEDKTEDGFIHLFHTIREFFAVIFKIKYEFTYEELINEITKKKISPEIKKKIIDFSKKISVIEYSDKALSKQLLKDSLEEFRHITRLLTKKPREKIKPARVKLEKLYRNEHILKVLHALRLYRTEAEKKEILIKKKTKKLEKEKEVKLLKEKYKRTKNIEDLASKAKKYIEQKNIESAKKTYALLNRLYQNSDSDSKSQAYDKVKDIYHEIVTYAPQYPKEKPDSIEKIKVSGEKINNLLLNIEDNIKKKDIKKAQLLYAIGYKLYTKLSLKEKKKIYPQLKKIHNILNTYK